MLDEGIFTDPEIPSSMRVEGKSTLTTARSECRHRVSRKILLGGGPKGGVGTATGVCAEGGGRGWRQRVAAKGGGKGWRQRVAAAKGGGRGRSMYASQ